MRYDLAVVGAGILGLAHAHAAVRRGLRVVVIDRDSRANGASVRNFGFATVTGQAAGDCHAMALKSRSIWAEVAMAAGIDILQRGVVITARRPETLAVLDAFLATDMAEGCRRLSARDVAEHLPAVRSDRVLGGLHSPHEIRVESRAAIPRIAAWLAETHGVDFRWNTTVTAVAAPRIETSRGDLEADRVVICPGDDFTGLFADRIGAYRATRCKLQMLRILPRRPVRLAAAVMSDLGVARYAGFADLPEAAALKLRLDEEQQAARENGVHLIVVQSADGSLVVGDSHHYADTPDPFSSTAVDDLILGELDAVLDLGGYDVAERWTGTYASAADRWRFTDAPDASTRVVVVTAGCGASTAFAIGEETVAGLL